VLPLHALWQQMPTAVVPVYSVEVRSRLTICNVSIPPLDKLIFNLDIIFVTKLPTFCTVPLRVCDKTLCSICVLLLHSSLDLATGPVSQILHISKLNCVELYYQYKYSGTNNPY
jgi:hypothetical protein